MGWAGDDCSIQVTGLTNGVNVTGTVGVKQWRFYYIETTTTLVVVVNETSNPSDCDIYLQKGQIPTRSSYAYRDISLNKDVSILVDPAGVGTRREKNTKITNLFVCFFQGIWFIGIYGFLQTNFIISAFTSFGACADYNNCNGHGRCERQRCVCNQYYMGEDCSMCMPKRHAPIAINHKKKTTKKIKNTDVPPMVLGTSYRGTIQTGEWNYYRLSLTSTSTLRFSVWQTSSGDLDLYVRASAIPTRYQPTKKNIFLIAFQLLSFWKFKN